MPKSELKALLAQGHLQEVIDILLKRTEGHRLHNEVVHQASRWSTYQQDKRNGTHDEAELQLSRNQINAALLQIIDQLDGATSKKSTAWWKYVVGVGVIVSILAGVVSTLKHLGYIGGDAGGASRSITVLVHGPAGKDDIVLPNRGLVYLIYGDAKISEQINNEGEATFKQISATFFEEDARVELLFEDPLGEPYRARYPDSSYQLQLGQYIALEAVLEGMDQLEGTIKDFVTGEPIDSVHIRIRGNSYYTNEFGEFTLNIPQDRQAQFIDMRLEKEGYESKELQNVPTTTGQPQIISIKPLQ